MSRILKFTHIKLSQVLNFLYTRCVEISYSLSILCNKTTTSRKYLGFGYTKISLHFTSQRNTGWQNREECNGWGMWRVLGRGEVCTGFWWGNLKEREHWRDPDVDGRIILRWIFMEVEGSCGDWMELARDRDRWRALVNKVMNFRVP